uniref:Transmembrane protein n=1 Tax=Medicago truncatula TaxID=3880 RepID=A2Q1R9_MEDTR|nr:hypothetical protein MtrDRAFT_AC149032g37v2 [Medicago truncatula]
MVERIACLHLLLVSTFLRNYLRILEKNRQKICILRILPRRGNSISAGKPQQTWSLPADVHAVEGSGGRKLVLSSNNCSKILRNARGLFSVGKSAGKSISISSDSHDL